MRVLITTVVHHPGDARIASRQIRALLEAGHQVVYAAPFLDYDVAPPSEVIALNLPRAHRLHRSAALRAARATLRTWGKRVDLIVLHDPELLAAVAGLRGLAPIVWDIHEDTAAAVSLKPWLPVPARPPVAKAVLAAERYAEKRYHLMFAEAAYQQRFTNQHPFIPNTTPVAQQPPPPPDQRRVVYVGHNSKARGVDELIALARLLGKSARVHVIGHGDPYATAALQQANEENVLTWHGFLPNPEALALVEGATAGLCLLRDEPNYRHSMITKIVEYMAHGVPIVATPLPLVKDAVERYEVGIVVPFNDAPAAAQAVQRLLDDDTLRHDMGRNGYEAALRHFSWKAGAKAFVTTLERWANDGSAIPGASLTPRQLRRQVGRAGAATADRAASLIRQRTRNRHRQREKQTSPTQAPQQDSIT